MQAGLQRCLESADSKKYLIALAETVLLTAVSVVSYKMNRQRNELPDEIIFFLLGFILGGWLLGARYYINKTMASGDYKYLPSSLRLFIDLLSPLLVGGNVVLNALLLIIPIGLSLANALLFATILIVLPIAYAAPGFYLLASIATSSGKS